MICTKLCSVLSSSLLCMCLVVQGAHTVVAGSHCCDSLNDDSHLDHSMFQTVNENANIIITIVITIVLFNLS